MNEIVIDLKFVPFPNPEVLMSSEEDGTTVLINFDSGHSMSLNRMGSFIWEAADGIKTVEDLIFQIIERFEGVPDHVENDVLELVEILKQNGYFGYEIR